MKRHKRYALYCYNEAAPRGGWLDCEGVSLRLEPLIQLYNKLDWWDTRYIIDLDTDSIVWPEPKQEGE